MSELISLDFLPVYRVNLTDPGAPMIHFDDTSDDGSTDAPPNSWVVVWTESRAEKKVEGRLAAMGLSPWLPTITERRRWSDRWREVVCPLFPGYLFAKARSVDWHKVLCTPGVLTVVRHDGRPALLADEFVGRLREAIERKDTAPEAVAEPVEYEPGEEVIVQEGPLAGLRGVVQESRNGARLIIWVAEVGRGVAFTIGSALVKSAP